MVKPCRLDMYKSRSNNRQASLFWDLETMLDPKHPLFKLANMVNWSCFEEAFAPLFCADNGRPPKPIRLMVGLLMLKHLRNVSDEFILKESIRINLAIEDKKKEEEDKKNKKDGRGRKNDEDQTAFIDSTVQEKNITYPTDSKLLNKIIDYCHKVAKAEGTKVRQSYTREVKELKLTQRFRGKAHSKKKVAKADRRMRTIAGALVRELQRELPADSEYRPHLELCMKFIKGELIDGHKIYSLHEKRVLRALLALIQRWMILFLDWLEGFIEGSDRLTCTHRIFFDTN